LTFARRPALPLAAFRQVMPVGIVALVFVLAAKQDITNWLLIGLHLAVFFVVAVVCHGELRARRPAATHLAEFYFFVSLGGALGGLFNALVAPVVFDHVVEYPLTLFGAALLVPPVMRQDTSGRQAVRRQKAAARQAASAAPSERERLQHPVVLDVLLTVVVLGVTAGLVGLLQEANRAATWPERFLM